MSNIHYELNSYIPLNEIIRKLLCSIYVYHSYASTSSNGHSITSSSSMIKVSNSVIMAVGTTVPGISPVYLSVEVSIGRPGLTFVSHNITKRSSYVLVRRDSVQIVPPMLTRPIWMVPP